MKDHIDGRVHVCGLPGKNLSPGCTKKKAKLAEAVV